MGPTRQYLIGVNAEHFFSVRSSLQVAGGEAKTLSHGCKCGEARI